MNYECFHCSTRFSQSDSLAANTSESQSKTYCSKECEIKDSEEIDRAIKEEQQRIAEYNTTHEDELRNNVTKQVGQFKLTVKP